MRRRVDYPLTSEGSSPEPGQIGFGSGFIDEDQSATVQLHLPFFPSLTCGLDVGALLLAGAERFFLVSCSSRLERCESPPENT